MLFFLNIFHNVKDRMVKRQGYGKTNTSRERDVQMLEIVTEWKGKGRKT